MVLYQKVNNGLSITVHHIQDYISFFREWGMPSPPVKTMCPIDPDKIGKKPRERDVKGEDDDSNKEGDNERKSRRNNLEARRERSLFAGPSVARAVHVNGRRVLLCNFNGIMFQVESLSLSLSLSLTHSLTQHTHHFSLHISVIPHHSLDSSGK